MFKDNKIQIVKGLENPFYSYSIQTLPLRSASSKEDRTDYLYPRLFNTLLSYFTNDASDIGYADDLLVSGNNFPKIDVWKEDNKYFISAVIAGIPKDEIDIIINEYNQLIFKYDSKPKTDEKKYIKKELSSASFCKKIQLPEYVDVDSSVVSYTDGIVTISFDFLPERKPKKLEIK